MLEVIIVIFLALLFFFFLKMVYNIVILIVIVNLIGRIKAKGQETIAQFKENIGGSENGEKR